MNKNYKKMMEEYHLRQKEGTLKIYKENEKVQPDTMIRCTKCRSTQLTSNNKRSEGVGLLGSIFGSKKMLITCLECGYQWKASRTLSSTK